MCHTFHLPALLVQPNAVVSLANRTFWVRCLPVARSICDTIDFRGCEAELGTATPTTPINNVVRNVCWCEWWWMWVGNFGIRNHVRVTQIENSLRLFFFIAYKDKSQILAINCLIRWTFSHVMMIGWNSNDHYGALEQRATSVQKSNTDLYT